VRGRDFKNKNNFKEKVLKQNFEQNNFNEYNKTIE
jgi:hypothetical protein